VTRIPNSGTEVISRKFGAVKGLYARPDDEDDSHMDAGSERGPNFP
jgi:hypothetical protein